MKGDFTRYTFQPEKHFRQVLMQQGRVQLDADWNEQSAIGARRDETTTADLAGHCGGPADGAAFRAVSSLADLTKVPAAVATWFNGLEAAEKTRITNALAGGDFLLAPGRYYVDGIQCELESPVLFKEQPDLPGQEISAAVSLLYLDVWPRHLTALEVPSLLETALNGVDTSTRVKTVWQVRILGLGGAMPDGNCSADIPDYNEAIAPSAIRLSAQTELTPSSDDPCQVPEASGYKGLENQLYRVEIHELNGDHSPKSFKWSRENGSVVTRLRSVDPAKKQLTVESLGRDEALGFAEGQFVEILDDALELQGTPGDLIRIADVDPDNLTITLDDAPDMTKFPDGIVAARHPKVRRWEGMINVKSGWIPLESGIQVRFDDTHARSRSGDYWQIPARAATPNAMAGDIEWPRKPGADGNPDPAQPISLLPRGVRHHFCRLGFFSKNPPAGQDKFTDCRCLWPALANLPRIFYVGGDGQEVMPFDPADPAKTIFKLPRSLVVGVANEHCAARALKVRFAVESPGTGRGVTAVGGLPASVADHQDIDVDAEGLASCDFYLDKAAYSQRASAQLLDETGNPVGLPIYFNATLSVATQVAYDPGKCAGLNGQGTVQMAIDRLADQLSLYKVSGDAQTLLPGATLAPVRVLAANRCGAVPLQDGWVSFNVVSGGGSVSPVTLDADGTAECLWTLGSGQSTQELEAVLQAAAGPAAEPKRVVFTAQRAAAAGGQDKGIHIVGISVAGSPLLNDSDVALAQLGKGLIVILDQAVEVASIRGKPTCFLTAEIPFPLSSTDQSFWDMKTLVGFEPLVLQADVVAKEKQILWQAPANVLQWLNLMLTRVQQAFQLPHVLMRLTLKGNFIWAAGDPKVALDGEVFGRPGPGGQIDINLDQGSGDGRRGGDFEMWFWLKLDTAPIKIKAEEKLTDKVTDKVADKAVDPKLTDKVTDIKITDAKVTENLAAPSGTSAKHGKGGSKREAGGKAFIRKEERPATPPARPRHE